METALSRKKSFTIATIGPVSAYAVREAPEARFFLTCILLFSSTDMYHNAATTPPSSVCDICLKTKQIANKKSNGSVSLLFSTTTHRQQQNCLHAYLLPYSTFPATDTAITAPTRSLSATYSVTAKTAQTTSKNSVQSHFFTLSSQTQQSGMLFY